jgi:hypothetical protein
MHQLYNLDVHSTLSMFQLDAPHNSEAFQNKFNTNILPDTKL